MGMGMGSVVGNANQKNALKTNGVGPTTVTAAHTNDNNDTNGNVHGQRNNGNGNASVSVNGGIGGAMGITSMSGGVYDDYQIGDFASMLATLRAIPGILSHLLHHMI
jgi:hypothetical protein